MQATTYVLIALAVVAIIIGAWMCCRAFKDGARRLGDYVHKKGLPILPRSERTKNIKQLSEKDDISADVDERLQDKIVVNILPKNEQDNLAKTVIQTLDNAQDEDALSNLAKAASSSQNTAYDAPKDGVHQSQNWHNTQMHASKESIESAHTAQAQDMYAPQSTDSNTQVLDDYFDQKQSQKDAQATTHAPRQQAQNIVIIVSPKNNFAQISGAQILQFVNNYALKFGLYNSFHRHENPDGTGAIWFGLLGMTTDGVASFDLNTLANDNYRSLALFLSLPHAQPLKGFDSMVSVAKDIAKTIDGVMHDEDGVIVDDAMLLQWRTLAESYISG